MESSNGITTISEAATVLDTSLPQFIRHEETGSFIKHLGVTFFAPKMPLSPTETSSRKQVLMSSLPTAVPLQLPGARKLVERLHVRRQKLWNLLHDDMAGSSSRMIDYWLNLSQQKRRVLITQALPESRRLEPPDAAAVRISTHTLDPNATASAMIDPFLLSCLDLEVLCSGPVFIHFLTSRSTVPPDQFLHVDLYSIHISPEFSYKTLPYYFRADSRQSYTICDGPQQRGDLLLMEGIVGLYVQCKLLQFLALVTRSTVQSKAPPTRNLEPPPFQFTIATKGQHIVPNSLDVRALCAVAHAQASEEQEHCLSLREDTDVFLREWSQWRTGHKDTPKLEILADLVRHAYDHCQVWRYISMHLDQLLPFASRIHQRCSIRDPPQALEETFLYTLSVLFHILPVLLNWLQQLNSSSRVWRAGVTGHSKFQSLLDTVDTSKHDLQLRNSPAATLMWMDRLCNEMKLRKKMTSVFKRTFSSATVLSQMTLRLIEASWTANIWSRDIASSVDADIKREFATPLSRRNQTIATIVTASEACPDMSILNQYERLPQPTTQSLNKAVRTAELQHDSFWDFVDQSLNVHMDVDLVDFCTIGDLLHELHPKASSAQRTKEWTPSENKTTDTYEIVDSSQARRKFLHDNTPDGPQGGHRFFRDNFKGTKHEIALLFHEAQVDHIPELQETTERRNTEDRETFSVDQGAYNTLEAILGTPPSHSIQWTSLVQALGQMSFHHYRLGGSSWHFAHPWLRAISIHEPHPGNELEGGPLLHLRRRLKKTYGWSMSSFRVCKQSG